MMASQAVSACVHRWRIAEQNGDAFLPGECVKCGARRSNFAASGDRKMKFGEKASARGRGEAPPLLLRKRRMRR